MQVIGVIPARYASTRFPGKPMASILQKSMIEWVYSGASQSKKISKVIVATDHKDIKSLVESFGGIAVMTDPDLPSGSDRVWKAVEAEKADVIINIQGDEPLITGDVLDELIGALEVDASADMATLCAPFKSDEDIVSPDIVKLITDQNMKAIYFSRFPIPYSRKDVDFKSSICKRHLGLYAYKKDFLKKFCEASPSTIEKAESLEQLRALEMGATIKVVEVDHESYGVDRPEDIARIEQILKSRN